MKATFLTLGSVVLLGGCVTGSGTAQSSYSLGGGEIGVFQSANAGKPIALERIKGMDDRELLATFGRPVLDRKDGTTRTLRYQSDACTLFVYMSSNRAQYADAYDPHLRPLPADQCAGSVAAQRRVA